VYCRIIPEENIIHDRCAGCFPTASNSNGTTSTISSPNSRQTSRLFEAVSAAFVLATRRRALLQDVAALKAVLAKLDKGSDEAQASAWALLSALCHHMKAGASAGGLWGSAFCVITAALTEFLDVVVPDGGSPAECTFSTLMPVATHVGSRIRSLAMHSPDDSHQ